MVHGAALEKRSSRKRSVGSNPTLSARKKESIMVEREYTSDSYIVNITPKGPTFPAVRIVKRKKVRKPSSISEDYNIGPPLGDKYAYDDDKINETARQIGRAILDDSEIIQLWRTKKA